MQFPKVKQVKIKSLDTKLWRIFSKYIRLKHSFNDGLCKCVTCGKIRHWKEMDAGHCFSRRYKYTKFDEKNVAPQCKYCNRFNQGCQALFAEWIKKIYGEREYNNLLLLHKKKCKLDSWWYIVKIEHYQKKLNELQNDTNI